ncbi:DUF4912 domain-containing protein [Sporohalobacter salinus]|uniref:DUF4912 domain-containing protein n=1 Tax=Sporohalobacter salinus TaxID=1494606 RepID=UPI001960DC22|nr:DUF4912 domain-containing protein [Sporohalobacter salinus]MBM7624971.1 hypothetical protein [Sporohalobacter salinus]
MLKSKEEGLSGAELYEKFLKGQNKNNGYGEQINGGDQNHNFQQVYADKYQLPESYDTNRLILQVKNPGSIFAYWEYTYDKLKEAVVKAGYEGIEKAPLVLRLYDLMDNKQESNHYDINITLEHDNWYLYDLDPDHAYEVDLGVLSDKFHTILKSNQVKTPRNSISDDLDEEWMTVTEKMEKIYTLAGIDELKNYNSIDITHKMKKNINKSHLKTGSSSLEVLRNSD